MTSWNFVGKGGSLDFQRRKVGRFLLENAPLSTTLSHKANATQVLEVTDWNFLFKYYVQHFCIQRRTRILSFG